MGTAVNRLAIRNHRNFPGAPEERKGAENKKQNIMQILYKQSVRGVEAGGLEPPTR